MQGYNEFYKLGEKFGLVHFQFAKYINDNYGGKNILLCGRDCYITHKILKDIFKNKNTKYIYVSRKALFNTAWNTNFSVDSEENSFLYNSIIFGRYLNVNELIKYLGLDRISYLKDTILEKVYEAGFSSLKDDIRPFQDNHEEIQNKIKTLVKSLELYLYTSVKYNHTIEAKRYLEPLVKDGDVFIDVGWNGTTQYFIENLLDIDLTGVYFETFKDVIKLPKEIKTDKFMKNFNNTCRGSQGLLEGCYFIAPHGSVLRYANDKPILAGIREDEKNIKKAIIQGSLDYCNKIYNSSYRDLTHSSSFMSEYCEMILFDPTLEDVQTINKIKHNNCGYGYSVVNYNGKYNELDFKRSFWKTGYSILAKN